MQLMKIAAMQHMIDYEVLLFRENGKLSVIIPEICSSDNAAMCGLVRMGVANFQTIEVWRGLELIYVGSGVRNSERHQPVATIVSTTK
jgi:hypothetical protein